MTQHQNSSAGDTIMLLKRSISPDGRIDSLSIEFSQPVDGIPESDLISRAESILEMQGKIAECFLNGNGAADPGKTPEDGCAKGLPAQMLSVGGLDTQWGRRLFITIQSNGQTYRLFGNRKRLAHALVHVGYSDLAEDLREGLDLNVPCRITTKPSNDGRYQNVDRIMPASASA